MADDIQARKLSAETIDKSANYFVQNGLRRVRAVENVKNFVNTYPRQNFIIFVYFTRIKWNSVKSVRPQRKND